MCFLPDTSRYTDCASVRIRGKNVERQKRRKKKKRRYISMYIQEKGRPSAGDALNRGFGSCANVTKQAIKLRDERR